MEVTGKTIWITGASSGIGRELALKFATHQNQIILSARNVEALREVADAVKIAGSEAIVFPVDFSDADRAQETASDHMAKLGRVDMAIHAAGISQKATVQENSLRVYRSVMEINYFGLISVVKTVLPYMLEAGNGSIVAISSVAGKVGSRNRSGYSGSKFAVCGFMDCLRAEVANQGIHCLTVCPGYVKTNIARNALDSAGSPRGTSTPQIEGGMSPAQCAERIYHAIRKQKNEVVVSSGVNSWAPLLNRLFPSLLRKVVAGRDM